VPEAEPQGDGRVRYRFDLRPGMLFQDDPAFAAFQPGARTREIEASDVAFQLMRLADPAVTSPISATLGGKLEDFAAFGERLAALREAEPGFAELRVDEQYRRAGGIAGVRADGRHGLDVVLREPYPQLRYWFAMPFTTPVPWEAVAFYDGREGRDFFKDHPVATGPFRVADYDKQLRVVLARNENWYGALHPEWRAPGATYPAEGEPGDAEAGLLAAAGRPLPFLDRIELRIEKEDIPTFNKFLQGYYDASGVIQESFDKIVHEGGLSPEMAALGMQLEKSVDPDIYYIGFNMGDPVVGAPAGERGRLLRQAMSLAVDVREYTRVFNNGRGVPAQSPLPPGIFGYEEEYVNPWRRPDLERARELLEKAGFPKGIDPASGRPLRLSFDLGDPSSRGRLRFQFFVDAWRRLGLDVELAATNYNQFQDKVKRGAYQIFMWGWVADYPDPENFYFLLWGPMGAKASGGPNTANFDHPRFNRLFGKMKDMESGPERLALIREMREIVEHERPWIELFHRENYALYHRWLANVKPAGLSLPAGKYQEIDAGERARLRAQWNRPVVWPAAALGGAALALLLPGVVTFLRERQ
jgi:ABC-type transport system substrate-binding protein